MDTWGLADATRRLHAEHPGERSDMDSGALLDAVDRGADVEDVLLAARAYGRLIRSQGTGDCLSVERWLDGLGRRPLQS